MSTSPREDDDRLFDSEPDLLGEAFRLATPSPEFTERVWDKTSRIIRWRGRRRRSGILIGLLLAYAAGMGTVFLARGSYGASEGRHEWAERSPDSGTPASDPGYERNGDVALQPATEHHVIELIRTVETGEEATHYIIYQVQPVDRDNGDYF